MTPAYQLRDIKRLLKANHYQVNPPALMSAHNDFRWGPQEIVACLQRLNDRPHLSDPSRNHYYKTEQHTTIRTVPPTEMDYYRIRNGPEGNKIFTKFYIRMHDGKLIITSFKEL